LPYVRHAADTGEMRQLQNDLSGDVGMPVRGNQNGEARGSKEGSYELLRRARRARLKAADLQQAE
jgi:hypothetical protein